MNKKEIKRKRLPLYVALIIMAGTVLEIIGILHIRQYGIAGDISLENIDFYTEAFIVAVFVMAFATLVAIIFIADAMYNRDSLTLVANADKAGAFASRKQMFKRLVNYTGVFINIKNFKYLNNTLGRGKADVVLREYALTLKKILGRKNFVGRVGGDNFILYVKNNQLDTVLKILPAITVYVDVEDRVVPCTINARAAIYRPAPGENHGNVMFNTSIAMAVAKEGKNGDFVWFTPDMTEKMIAEKRIIADFEKAILEDEFSLNYQPKYNLRNKELIGAEATVVWKNDDLVLQADKFVPIFEKYNKIQELDMFVLKMVCSDIKEWMKCGIKPVRISVNFSRKNLIDPGFAKKIISVITESEVPTEYLEIEITESYAQDDEEALNSFIDQIRKASIRLALDNFGVGYSTLSLIPKLDFDVIKLDKCFIKSMDSKRQCGFLSNLIHMLTALDYEVACGGIETEEQYSFLDVVGCSIGQGTYFSKRLSQDEFRKML